MTELEIKSRNKPGPKPKYLTEEERKEANRERVKKYYERNKDEVRKKQVERYSREKERLKDERRKINEIYKLYKEGKITIEN